MSRPNAALELVRVTSDRRYAEITTPPAPTTGDTLDAVTEIVNKAAQ